MEIDRRRAELDFLDFMASRYDADRNKSEGDLVLALAELSPGQRVLDLACGWGRLARHLTNADVSVVGIDNSETMIEAARQNAPKTERLHRDMKDLSDIGDFDAVVIWWSSFGVFHDRADLDLLRQIRAALHPGGRLVIETGNAQRLYSEAYANKEGKTFTSRIGNDVMLDVRRLNDDGRRVLGARTFFRRGEVTELPYDKRIFTPSKLEHWLLTAGFSSVSLYDRKGEPFRWTSYSLVAVAVN